ncbi:MAG TPA: META domain-containing protein [Methylomirabilota bacterium]|nr:META domain-containing protein [Methylomirabilota bacterium]
MKAMIVMLLLSGCSLLSGGGTASLDGEWLLQAGTNQGVAIPLVAGSTVTLQVAGTQAGGSAACNSYGGKLQVSGSTISIGELFQTEMACLDNRLMELESAYLAALPRVTTAARSGNGLLLTGPQVELRFTLVPPVANAKLVGTTWILDSLITGDAVSSTVGERVTLQFSADFRLAASTGCRNVTGTYTISGEQGQVTLDPYDTIGCAAELGDQDAHILEVLSHSFGISVDGDRLTLTAGDKGIGYRADR